MPMPLLPPPAPFRLFGYIAWRFGAGFSRKTWPYWATLFGRRDEWMDQPEGIFNFYQRRVYQSWYRIGLHAFVKIMKLGSKFCTTFTTILNLTPLPSKSNQIIFGLNYFIDQRCRAGKLNLTNGRTHGINVITVHLL